MTRNNLSCSDCRSRVKLSGVRVDQLFLSNDLSRKEAPSKFGTSNFCLCITASLNRIISATCIALRRPTGHADADLTFTFLAPTGAFFARLTTRNALATTRTTPTYKLFSPTSNQSVLCITLCRTSASGATPATTLCTFAIYAWTLVSTWAMPCYKSVPLICKG